MILILGFSVLSFAGCSDSDNADNNNTQHNNHKPDNNGNGSGSTEKPETNPDNNGNGGGTEHPQQPNPDNNGSGENIEKPQPEPDGNGSGGDTGNQQNNVQEIKDPAEAFLHSLLGEYNVEVYRTNLAYHELFTLSNDCKKRDEIFGPLPSSEECVQTTFTTNKFKFEEKNGGVSLNINFDIGQDNRTECSGNNAPYCDGHIGNHVSIVLDNIKLEEKNLKPYKLDGGELTLNNQYLSGKFVIEGNSMENIAGIFKGSIEKDKNGNYNLGLIIIDSGSNKRMVLGFYVKRK